MAESSGTQVSTIHDKCKVFACLLRPVLVRPVHVCRLTTDLLVLQIAPYTFFFFKVSFYFLISFLHFCKHPKLVLVLQCLVYLVVELISNMILCIITFLVCFYFILNDNISSVEDLGDLAHIISSNVNQNRRSLVESSLRRFINMSEETNDNRILVSMRRGDVETAPQRPNLDRNMPFKLGFNYVSAIKDKPVIKEISSDISSLSSIDQRLPDWNFPTDDEDVVKALSFIRKDRSSETFQLEEIIEPLKSSHSESSSKETGLLDNEEKLNTENDTNEVMRNDYIVNEVKDVKEVINYFESVHHTHNLEQTNAPVESIGEYLKCLTWDLVKKHLEPKSE
ncbi:uncharacterized protein LOC103524292 isoform X2 [Diaphorina citri]|uniref:Uncharacterized protein LOC103524292 isoform X1 n=1 Tax=Diaphorina citri TaxID=121845 RepID=A0A1S3DTY8_DIACI|nr:uncharacterized protein LOC103524292 isoform X1 [Diaphorina citri]XP_026689190.1 uncharacterized protein LOC103524292 isoform X2 [Diaphorina citri]